jgi:hypothetical protein
VSSYGVLSAAQRSEAAHAKAASRRTAADLPVHSFATLVKSWVRRLPSESRYGSRGNRIG